MPLSVLFEGRFGRMFRDPSIRITFDPTSLQQQVNDPDALTDFRTPRYDLDSLYGRGPDDSPYL